MASRLTGLLGPEGFGRFPRIQVHPFVRGVTRRLLDRRVTLNNVVSFNTGHHHPAPYTLHPTPYTLHPTPYTLHPTPYTLHPTSYTLHPTPYTLDPKPYTLNPPPSTLNHKP